MKRFFRLISTISFLTAVVATTMANPVSLIFQLRDRSTGDALAGVTVNITNLRLTGFTDADGRFRITLEPDSVASTIHCVGYESITERYYVNQDTTIWVNLVPKSAQLGEVVVTAQEKISPESTSRISKSAMEHLQPTSFTDILELLPGNISHNPNMTLVNSINLRETGTLNAQGNRYSGADYAITSLGTLFLVDGAPLNTDASIQSEGLTVSDATSPAANTITTNRGVDMRTISTDNIESVEIVRGIPSAEYGNLSSGMVNIKRIHKHSPFTFRFKADEHSKLFSAAKGVGFHGGSHVLNLDFGYLDYKNDPRILSASYRRITGSARMNMRFGNGDFTTTWNYGFDFTGGLDDSKADPDLNYKKIDEFRDSYNRAAFTSNLTVNLNPGYPVNMFHLSLSSSLEIDRMKHKKDVALSRATVAPTSLTAGESFGTFLPGTYMAHYVCDGRPFSFFLKAVAKGGTNLGFSRHNYKCGMEWTVAKNFGKGQVYDLSRPLSGSWTSRPRAYSEIPALHVLSFFLEDNMQLPVGVSLVELQAGIRSIQLPHIDRRYSLSNKVFLDPRVNLLWRLPQWVVAGRKLNLYFGAGYGLTTKMPTVDYLYPQASYVDFLQLNYFDAADRERNMVSLMTYINDATNYKLRPARNRKLEVRTGLDWGAVSLQVTLFGESMTDGFRYSALYAPYTYKQYDISAIPAEGMFALGDIPYQARTVLAGYRYVTNGSRIIKRGLEFTLNTTRWQPVRTSLTVTGAWFRSEYTNSQDIYEPVSQAVGGVSVSDNYIGLYHTRDGRVNEQFNTNFMFDTQIQRPGLIITTTFQFMWFVKTRSLPENGVPDYYLATDGLLHPYTEESKNDPVLQFLTRHYNDALYRTQRIPLAMYMNLKVTKPIGRHIGVSLFVNRIFDYLPDYKSNGLLIRRSADAYFGVELNLKF